MKTVQGELLEYLRFLKDGGTDALPATRSAPSGHRRAVAPPPPAPPTAGSPVPAAARPPAPPPPPPPSPAAAPAPPPASTGSPGLDAIAAEIAACDRCPLCATRNRVVPGQGNPSSPDIMFVGEGPGADEDAQGLAFVGRAGKLLTQMIAAMGYDRSTLFIGNIVKCRPPGNRVPTPEEMAGCIPYLHRQIALVRPKMIVCLGATAARGLVGETRGITKVRGQWREFDGIPVLLSYHPAFLLRDPSRKREAWADLKAALAHLGKAPPPPPPRP